MQSEVILSLHKNLNSAISLLDTLPQKVYTNDSVGPYYSSIGSHMRHCLDFYDCTLNGLGEGTIDLTGRKRDMEVATQPKAAKQLVTNLKSKLNTYTDTPSETYVSVVDDLGAGCITMNQTVEGIFAQACSHATHHFAIISYILNALDVQLEIPGFGYNPTTPVVKRVGI